MHWSEYFSWSLLYLVYSLLFDQPRNFTRRNYFVTIVGKNTSKTTNYIPYQFTRNLLVNSNFNVPITWSIFFFHPTFTQICFWLIFSLSIFTRQELASCLLTNIQKIIFTLDPRLKTYLGLELYMYMKQDKKSFFCQI